MKKLILLFGILLFAVAAFSQDVSQSLGRNSSNVTYTGVASDTITNTDTWSYQFNLAGKHAKQGYDLHVKLDSVSGTPADACILAGSQDASTYVNIDTISWSGTTSDTTLIFRDVSTGVLYRYLRFAITGTGTQKAKVNQIYGKIGDL